MEVCCHLCMSHAQHIRAEMLNPNAVPTAKIYMLLPLGSDYSSPGIHCLYILSVARPTLRAFVSTHFEDIRNGLL